jgi:hypothetical protein
MKKERIRKELLSSILCKDFGNNIIYVGANLMINDKHHKFVHTVVLEEKGLKINPIIEESYSIPYEEIKKIFPFGSNIKESSGCAWVGF